MDGGGGYHLHDGVRLFSGKGSMEAERVEAALPVESPLEKVLGEFLN